MLRNLTIPGRIGDQTWVAAEHCEQHHRQLAAVLGHGMLGHPELRWLQSAGNGRRLHDRGRHHRESHWCRSATRGTGRQRRAHTHERAPRRQSSDRSRQSIELRGCRSTRCFAAARHDVRYGRLRIRVRNGVVDLGETCDDGNTLDGDCCSADCQLEPAGTICRPVGRDCDVAETCDGVASACPADDAPACPTATATTTPTPTATPTATPTPMKRARRPRRRTARRRPFRESTLTLKDKTKDANDSLTWQWLKGSPTSRLDSGRRT